LAAVARVCDSQTYILGPEVGQFEREFAALCTTSESVACASGTDALWLALAAAGIKSGDSVVTTPFSIFATDRKSTRLNSRPCPPPLPTRRSSDLLAAVARVCDSQAYILGPEVGQFEREFAALCTTSESVACASDTDALWHALAAAVIKGGDSVVTTPFSIFA